MASLLYAHAFERGMAVDKAGTDSALYVDGIDIWAVLDEDEIVGLEGWLHAGKAEFEAVSIGGPKVPKYGEHLKLRLRFRWFPGWYGSQQRKLAGFHRLWRVVVWSGPDEHGLWHVEGDGEGVNSAFGRVPFVLLDRRKEPLIDAG